MLVQKNTRVFETAHRAVQPATVIADEGIALAYVKDQGKTYVRPSTGAQGETFAGFSLSRNTPPLFIPKVIETVIPESGILALGRTPITGQLLVQVNGSTVSVGASAPTAADESQLSGEKLYFFTGTPAQGQNPAVAGVQGKKVRVQMMYSPTVAEARTIVGDAPIGGLPSTAQEIIGAITRADSVATTYYDASVDWSNVIHPRLGADGRLTTGGQGTLLTNVVVLEAPSSDAGSFGPLIVELKSA